MTKKDYIVMASIIEDSTSQLINASEQTRRYFALKTAEMFRADNNNFPAQRYFEACGFNADTVASLCVLM